MTSTSVQRDKLIVFIKAPRPGSVKTRIARTAGPERATEIYCGLVESVLDNVASLRDVELRFTPDDAYDEIKHWLRPGWSAAAQGDGDLGARMARAFASAFDAGAQRVVIIGSDAPELSAGDVQAAWRELTSHDVVVGPAVDGGYWLIGLRAPRAELFDGITWSSEHVLGETLACAKQLKLRIQLLRILSDVDTEEDWNAHVRAAR